MAKSSLLIIFMNLLNLSFNLYGLDGRVVGGASNVILKTIYGDEYNCIDIYKQPAFEHPALKNHKISMEVIEKMEKVLEEKERDENCMFHPKNIWSGGRGCPKGTVPIRRQFTKPSTQPTPSLFSTMEFIRETKNYEILGCGEDHIDTYPEATNARIDFAGIVAERRQDKNYRGASAHINLYNPTLNGNDETSSAIISIRDPTNAALVQAGWTVNPSLYGDTKTRLFTGWELNGKSCYNAICPGYVILNRNLPFDFAFPNTSQVEKDQFDTYFGIFLHDDNHWYFNTGINPYLLGYWPNEIFNDLLKGGGGSIAYGGLVTSMNDVSPQMGSGQLINLEYDQSCYMRQVKVMDENSNLIDADNSFIVGKSSRCYFEDDHHLDSDPFKGYAFLFGGRGGKDCYDCVY